MRPAARPAVCHFGERVALGHRIVSVDQHRGFLAGWSASTGPVSCQMAEGAVCGCAATTGCHSISSCVCGLDMPSPRSTAETKRQRDLRVRTAAGSAVQYFGERVALCHSMVGVDQQGCFRAGWSASTGPPSCYIGEGSIICQVVTVNRSCCAPVITFPVWWQVLLKLGRVLPHRQGCV